MEERVGKGLRNNPGRIRTWVPMCNSICFLFSLVGVGRKKCLIRCLSGFLWGGGELTGCCMKQPGWQIKSWPEKGCWSPIKQSEGWHGMKPVPQFIPFVCLAVGLSASPSICVCLFPYLQLVCHHIAYSVWFPGTPKAVAFYPLTEALSQTGGSHGLVPFQSRCLSRTVPFTSFPIPPIPSLFRTALMKLLSFRSVFYLWFPVGCIEGWVFILLTIYVLTFL